MAASYDIAPFSSTNPAIDALFTREFAQRQADREAVAKAAAGAIARSQIGAQSQLAQAQLEQAQAQQQYNNLFREREFQAKEAGDKIREEQINKQLEIDKAWKVPRTDLESERRKQAIIDANANNVNDAARANALYQIALEAELARAKKEDVSKFMPGLRGGPTIEQLDDPNHPVRRALNKKVFDSVYRQLVAEKGGTVQAVVPDPATFTFKPIQFDETGKSIALPLPAPKPTIPNDNPAGLGTIPDVSTTVTPAYGGPGTTSFVPRVDLSNFSSVPTTANPNPAALGVTVQLAAPQPSVRRLLGNTAILLTPEDDATLQRQLLSIPAEQRPAAYRAMVEQWFQSGRARLAPTVPIAPEPEPNYNRF